MKKKLLITLGCSFTEGVGCYDPELVTQCSDQSELKKKSLDRFHSEGWPPKLQQKIKYDKLINLGKEGTGESFHLKRFIEEFGEINLVEEYDVLIVWMTSPPGRLSFYVDGSLCSILSNWNYMYDKPLQDMSHAYAQLIENVELDPILEQAFYIKTLKEICNGKGYDLLIFPTGNSKLMIRDTQGSNNNILNITENMSFYYANGQLSEIYHEILPLDIPRYQSILKCNHPNEDGYELVAQRMLEIIKIHNPTLINSNTPIIYENEWRDSRKC
jgi:hypothetical protein